MARILTTQKTVFILARQVKQIIRNVFTPLRGLQLRIWRAKRAVKVAKSALGHAEFAVKLAKKSSRTILSKNKRHIKRAKIT